MKKISELPAATTVADDAAIPASQSGITQRITPRQLAEAAQSMSFAKQHALGVLPLGE